MGKSIYDPVTVLPQVGAKRLEALHQLGIFTVLDLLSHYPFRYEDIQVKDLSEIEDQEKVTLKGDVVSEAVLTRFGPKKNRLVFRMAIDHAVIAVTFFNQPYLKSKIHAGEEIAVFGKWDDKRKSLTGMKILGAQIEQEEAGFESIYSANKGIKQKTILNLVTEAFARYEALIPEIIPAYLKEKYRLISHRDAIYAMHFPTSEEQTKQARREVVFEEFFVFQMKMQVLRKQEKAVGKGTELTYNVADLRRFIASLPFELTNAQKRVVNEICGDLRKSLHMHRLLQGDVGSGKTIVAAIALFATSNAGFQSALMVPTEILAEQHMESLVQLFDPLEVRIALLTGSTKTKMRREILTELANGELDVLIGTHALIQEDVSFHNLGLVITDEQHRFGVNQRKILREKGDHPDVLFMTATPIPRTLAITAYGEMDVSIIDELPAGRIPIETTWTRPKNFEHTLHFIETQLRKGSQAYVICPLIEESESLDVKNATDIYEKLQAYYEPNFQVGLLHGKMKPAEKEAVMERFKKNQLQVLVSTTVIEVGVNVPNATTMVIYDADRFGLSQLHQLRGRVGRGTKESYCILVANPKNDTGIERMKIMTETTDGFVLSEKDLELRGAGDLFGSKQSGAPEFKVGDIIGDFGALEAARNEAALLVNQEAFYVSPDYQSLRREIGIENMDSLGFD
ncbi:ATP-dependent DNA helicase RecG [Carnobacterium divergens]|uniref:ATP-dependent DNA helicase RecG n=1 Tax=Carnobacterium divergens TaxID=2748 RepID=A0AAW8RBK9_CARDV|nr:ATP-dependent DNA helicase RecG [Carnobacterium divergens]MDT1957420.1 ATP-dependent DNA helicase RecG [Carnobacterium divergens]MDT1973623.1 ATP-dependent DNA helicase RecG [Carnobacterium divergens]MDT1996404.1 ATP-dependent DNA helicase RecG [Carnobacterium divergens]TFI62752.1 ATP-dependent DNA helicase RecG [Carnobacterium divergens]TFI63103.1 ATP-dependent DNA helicase RecG [Carnobacterium divergens]